MASLSQRTTDELVPQALLAERVWGLRVLATPDEALRERVVPLVGAAFPIGRDAPVPAGTGLVVADTRLSRVHALVRGPVPGEGHLLEDRGSRNGTFCNGVRVRSRSLEPGDLIRVGDTLLLYDEITALATPAPAAPGCPLVHASMVIQAIIQQIQRVASSELPVLILGESGTGKELVAREVHRLSGRRGPFLAVNCGSLPANLVESELFGHARGAFTGAIAASPGLFRSATGGTLFLDEVGELPLSLQPRLLRVLEQGEVRPVGCPTTQRVDVRVVAATNADLDRACREERFRGDLLARLDQVRLSLPPLRRRRQDIPPLLAHFFQKHAPASPPHDYELDALERLLAYSWPYNVRELEKTVRLLLLEHPLLTRVTAALLPPCFATAVSAPASAPARAASPQPSPATSCRVGPAGLPGREELVALLEQTHGRVSEVATALGKDRRQIYRWLRRHDLDPELFRG